MPVEITTALRASDDDSGLLLVHPVGENYTAVAQATQAIVAFLTAQNLDVWAEEKHGSMEIWIEKVRY